MKNKQDNYGEDLSTVSDEDAKQWWEKQLSVREESIGTMEKVKIKKDELLKVVQQNRQEHRSIFEKALEGYKNQVIAELEVMLAEAREGKRIRRRVELDEPCDQTKEYDRVIRMLELSQDDIIELTQPEFSQYVMDDWRWKDQFIATSRSYTTM